MPLTPKTADAGCEAQRPILDAAFQEAVAIAQNAVDAIEQVRLGRDNWVAFSNKAQVSAGLQAVFGIRTGGFRVPMTETDEERVEDVLGGFTPGGGGWKMRLMLSDRCLSGYC